MSEVTCILIGVGDGCNVTDEVVNDDSCMVLLL